MRVFESATVGLTPVFFVQRQLKESTQKSSDFLYKQGTFFRFYRILFLDKAETYSKEGWPNDQERK